MSILEEAIPATEIKRDNLIKALLVGAPKTGKTESACTLPGKKLILDLDNRAETVAGDPNVEIIKLHPTKTGDDKVFLKLEQLGDEIWEAIRKDKFPYDGVIMDGLTSANRWGIWWALQLRDSKGKVTLGFGGAPAQQHYNPQMFALSKIILNLIPIPRHFILTAHFDFFENKDTGEWAYWPKMYGQTRTEIGGWFNETYECFHKGSKELKYFWNTRRGSSMGFIGSAMNKRGEYWKDPVEIDFDSPPVGFQRLLEYRYGTSK